MNLINHDYTVRLTKKELQLIENALRHLATTTEEDGIEELIDDIAFLTLGD